MESIESLNTALDKYTGRWCSSRTTASSCPPRHAHLELRPSAGGAAKVIDYRGGYDDYSPAPARRWRPPDSPDS